MLDDTIIDSQYRSFVALREYLSSSSELTHAEIASDALRRSFVISAASFFEYVVKQAIADFPIHSGNGHPAVISLVRKGIVDRGYHTLFDWDSSSPNRFFSHFGEELGNEMKQRCRESPALRDSAAMFLSLGGLRNTLVHSNFAALSFDTSLDEAYVLYDKAKLFVNFVVDTLGPKADAAQEQMDQTSL